MSRCQIWKGAKNALGYGIVRFKGRLELAHRLAYVLAKGPLPRRKPVVMHLCENPSCVNPGHLRAGTQAENMAHWAQGRRRRRAA